MIDSVTKQPFTDKRLAAVLGEVWETIGSGGANKRLPGEQLGKGALAKQRTEQRFLAFQSADAWMTYQRQFGDRSRLFRL